MKFIEIILGRCVIAYLYAKLLTKPYLFCKSRQLTLFVTLTLTVNMQPDGQGVLATTEDVETA